MKILHLIIYFLINITLVGLLSLLKLNPAINVLLISFVNIGTIFLSQKQTVIEVLSLAEKAISFDNENNAVEKQSSEGYLPDMKNIINKFSEINEGIKKFSEETQKPLTISLEAVLNSTVDGIIVVNNEREIVMANDSFFKLCGYKAFEISGKDQTTMVSPENILSRSLIRFIRYSFENCLNDMNAISTGIIEIVHTNPKTTLRATATPLKYTNESLDGLVVNLKDISKEIEASIEKEDFILNISHELRTPLSSMIGFGNLIMSDNDMDIRNMKSFVKTMLEESMQLSDIVENLLNALHLAKDDFNVTLQKINYQTVIKAVANELEPKIAANNLTITYEFDDDISEIISDNDSLETMISNLFSNAVKFSHINKEIIIKSQLREKDIVISFIDHGDSIPKEYKEKIFEKFFRIENEVHTLPGAGLGLYVAKNLAKSHGGDIYFDSNKEKTIFYLKLPVNSKFEKGAFNLMNKKF